MIKVTNKIYIGIMYSKYHIWLSYLGSSKTNLTPFQPEQNANNENKRRMCKICSKLTIKTLERRHPLSGKVIVKEIQIFCTIIFLFNE